MELSHNEIEGIVRSTVLHTLTELGIDHTEPFEVQKDMAALRGLRELYEDPDFQKDQVHLRRWRITMDTVANKGVLAALGFAILGVVALIWVGVSTKLGLK